MHKHKKYTYTVKLCGAIGFPVVDKIENPLLKNLGMKKPWGDKTLLAIQGCETLHDIGFTVIEITRLTNNTNLCN